jgi:hypothetical protein
VVESDPWRGDVYFIEDIGEAHHDMEAGKVVFGNRVALVGAPEKRLGTGIESSGKPKLLIKAFGFAKRHKEQDPPN